MPRLPIFARLTLVALTSAVAVACAGPRQEGPLLLTPAVQEADPPLAAASLQTEPALPQMRLNPDLYSAFRPSNDRAWTKDQQIMPQVEVDGNRVVVHNVRNVVYRTVDDYDVSYTDRTYDLDELTSLDFIVVPFNDIPAIAHTMLSFGFQDRDYLGVSVEIRKEQGETYSPVRGFFNQYELMYVMADERDLILKNTNQWLTEVYVYRTVAAPEQVRELFLDVARRTNQLKGHPEFYNTLSNNCTTNIRDHINHCFPGRVPYDYRILLPGYSDKLAYDLGLLATRESFAEARLKARVNYQAYLNREAVDFSQKIRQR